MDNFIIKDWAGNEMYAMGYFKDFDSAEAFLCGYLGDNYDTDRQEYYIEEKTPHGNIRHGSHSFLKKHVKDKFKIIVVK